MYAMNRRTAMLGAGAALLGAAMPALATIDKTVRLIVPFAAGGPGDFTARQIAVPLSRELGQNVIVENKPGANGNLGAQSVADAPADGSQILLNTVGMEAINPLLYPSMRYSPTKDFLALGIVALVPNVLVVHPEKLGVEALQDLVRLGKLKPRGLSYATFGPGSSPHIYTSLLLKSAGIEAVQIPYKGSAPASTDVMAGNVDFLFDSMTTSVELIRGGKLKGLTITSAQRSPLLKDVPTIKECGYPEVDLKFWLSLQINARTPAPIVESLRKAIYNCLRTREYAHALAVRGAEVLAIEPDRVQQCVMRDVERWQALGKEINIQPV
ncbi:MAG: tripartite tricarboxylate transporter substrate binding protein [Desulfovibrionaceae bacterium]|jgi:tripartite-type tricarboxylate transporter receptor subunit TctC|nr:tripartite tricarboxylate transporter substrate binding protein [Desulfovibrionaceae bacterium]